MDLSNHDELGQIEAALRSERPRLGGDVESAICGRVGARSGGGRRASFAVVLTVGTLVGMSALGGVGYANFGFFGFNPFHPPHISKPPSKDQYGKGPKHHKGYPGNTKPGHGHS